MPIQTSMTEADVKQYMEDVLGDTAGKLGWSVGGDDFDEPTNEILYSLDEASFSFVTTQALVKKIRAVARVEVWRFAMFSTAHETIHSTGAPGTGQTSRSVIHQHCRAMFAQAKSHYVELFPDEQSEQGVSRWSATYEGDYYANAED